jgi:hypothetical protein
MGVRAPLVIVGTRLQDELLEKTEAYRTFRHPRATSSFAGAQRGNPVAERERLLSLRKTSTAWRASIGRACQGAGFHATFSHAAALCDAVWPN